MEMDGVSGECSEVASWANFTAFVSEHSELIAGIQQVDRAKHHSTQNAKHGNNQQQPSVLSHGRKMIKLTTMT